MINLWFGVDIIVNIFHALVFSMFLNGFLSACKIPKIYEMLCWLMFSAVVSLVNYYKIEPLFTVLASMTFILAMTFIYSGALKEKLFATSLLIVSMVVADMVTMYTIMLVTSVDSTVAQDYGFLRLTGLVFSSIIIFILLKVMVLMKKRYYVKIPFSYWVALLLIPAISIFTVILIFLFNDHLADRSLVALSLFSTVGVLYSNIIVFYLFDAILEKAEFQAKNEILERQLKSQLEHYKELEISYKTVRQVKHDLKNHLIFIKHQIVENNAQNALDYIQSIGNVVMGDKKYTETGNHILDCILNAKLMLIENTGIKVNYTIQIPEKLSIDPMDFCIIFGNALDNAIEACNRCSKEDIAKFINVFVTYQNNSLICKIENSTDGKIKKINGKYISSKSNFKDHGLGFQNINNAILKYKGSLNTAYANNIFELKFVLMNV